MQEKNSNTENKIEVHTCFFELKAEGEAALVVAELLKCEFAKLINILNTKDFLEEVATPFIKIFSHTLDPQLNKNTDDVSQKNSLDRKDNSEKDDFNKDKQD